MWKQRKKEDNGMNGGGDGKGWCGQIPTLPGDKKVSPAWFLQRGSQSVPVRLSDDN